MSTQPETATDNTQTARTGRAAFLAGAAGWTLDAFDFFLVVFSLTGIGKEFHQSDAAMSLSIVMTLAFRPLGGLVFGLLADRYGRRRPMVWNLVLCALAQLFTGLAPNFGWFLASRALFGTIMGGQWGVGATMAMEAAPVRLRGLLSGILQQGYAMGYLLAALAYALMFERYGWRPLFFVACAPALLAAVYVARCVKESAVWEQTRHQSWSSFGRGLRANWKLLAYIALFTMAMHMSSHGSQDMYPTFLERQWGYGPGRRALLTAVSMGGALAGGTLCGLLSDRWGRRRSIITALAGAILVTPLWAFAPTAGLLATGAVLMQFLIQGAWGVVPAHLAELTPDALRGFIPGFGNACGVVLASSVVYAEALFARHTSYATAMASTAAVVLSMAIGMTWAGREKRAARFGGWGHGQAPRLSRRERK